MKALFLILAIAFSIAGCTKSSTATEASTSPVPDMLPIVKESLPSTLESSAAIVVRELNAISPFANSNLTELQTRMFAPGPVDFQFRIKKIDERLDSLADAIKACESSTTTTYNPPAVANSWTFSMEFSCVQTIDASAQGVSDMKVYFGKSGGYWYVGEFQTNADFASGDGEPASMAVLARIAEDGNSMTAVQISVENISSVEYATFTQIIADKENGIFEISTASSASSSQTASTGANFTGLGCGVQMRTDSTLIYAAGVFEQGPTCGSVSTVCATAADFTDTSGCGSLTSFATLALDRTDISGANAKSMIVDRSGLPSF
jgi:hypothetical protein